MITQTLRAFRPSIAERAPTRFCVSLPNRKLPSPHHVEELFPGTNVIAFHRPIPLHTEEGNFVETSHGKNGHSPRGHESPSSSVTTDNLVDFCQQQALRRPVKEVQRTTGLSKKQVENIRQGLSAVSGRTLTNWIKNDPDFAGDYAEFSGIIRPGEARWASMITRLANEVARNDSRGRE